MFFFSLLFMTLGSMTLGLWSFCLNIRSLIDSNPFILQCICTPNCHQVGINVLWKFQGIVHSMATKRVMHIWWKILWKWLLGLITNLHNFWDGKNSNLSYKLSAEHFRILLLLMVFSCILQVYISKCLLTALNCSM